MIGARGTMAKWTGKASKGYGNSVVFQRGTGLGYGGGYYYLGSPAAL